MDKTLTLKRRARSHPRLSIPSLKLATPRRALATPLQFRWAEAISKPQWRIYQKAIRVVRDAKIPFLLGGGFALAAFTGRWRDTKDIDLYIHPQDRRATIDALTRAGFKDYYSRLPYDRKWIYRNVHSNVIVDIIWSMANQRARVDELWFQRAGSVAIRGERIDVLPLEEFIWCKLYILQRDHCDWTDLFNLLHATGSRMDWNHLIERLEDDTPLLRGLLSVYSWLCPKRAQLLPEYLWRLLELPRPPLSPAPRRNRIRLLDTRAWFGPNHPASRKLEV